MTLAANFSDFAALVTSANGSMFILAEQIVRDLMGANATAFNITIHSVCPGSIIIDYTVEALSKQQLDKGLDNINASIGQLHQVVVSEELSLIFEVGITDSRVTFITDTPSEQSEDESDHGDISDVYTYGGWVIVGIVCVILVCVCLVVLIVMMRRRHAKEEATSLEAEMGTIAKDAGAGAEQNSPDGDKATNKGVESPVHQTTKDATDTAQ